MTWDDFNLVSEVKDFQLCKNAFTNMPPGLCVCPEKVGELGQKGEGGEEKDKRVWEMCVLERLKKLSAP